ncbi:DNA-binding protein [Geovibrio thiophilus]|uniref:DNA-binding protein n=1 Tax=Geovibrio thiophilus TaxID=139438 RepID=A0A410JV24_9BACT|nr:helix-turn-helix domain-containing protein [Geovibrio thiophilus]QAR32032.1 DNA-binding protein [Geovibrio thiophilus]
MSVGTGIEKRLFSIQEAAAYTGFSEHTLYDWIYKRKIEHVKISRRVFISRDTLENLITSNTVKARGII